MQQPEESVPDSPIRRPSQIGVQFLLGLMLGVLLAGVPLSYLQFFAPAVLRPIHLFGSAGFVLLCGLLAAWRGGPILALLMQLLESFPTA